MPFAVLDSAKGEEMQKKSEYYVVKQKAVPEVLLKVYDSARCHLDPAQWLQSCIDNAELNGAEDISQTVWGKYLMDDLFRYLDLQIEAMKSSGAGGQHVNKTESAIRITHLPTGTVVECQDERSQYKNKDKALKVLKSRLLKEKQDKQANEIAESRKSQVGTGDRSERIRTYNYPQGRLTDHRIGLTLYKLEDILNGNLDEVIDALVTADRAEKLKESMAQS